MPSESKSTLKTQTEKPIHYSYLKEFRVDQCAQFTQHKCAHHRPFACFHWHFTNQRRRRPIRKRDGSFNYSSDTYCQDYNESTGVCPAGDDCPFLHRTAGDTERRYHLRYYKTCFCVHDTDAKGHCVKNGAHCAFAHGDSDLRAPVFDLREFQAAMTSEDPKKSKSKSKSKSNSPTEAPNALDKEKCLMNEDPQWQETNHIIIYYKTEACRRPARLCRQGYACPMYHSTKDRRRCPQKFKYRSTACPNVKVGEDWGEPSACEDGDKCTYCHTRTEQQFHPEIYKSSRCHDIQSAGYCPRGVFCAFAHVDQEMTIAKPCMDNGTNLVDLICKALPPLEVSSDLPGCPSTHDTYTSSTSSGSSASSAAAVVADTATSSKCSEKTESLTSAEFSEDGSITSSVSPGMFPHDRAPGARRPRSRVGSVPVTTSAPSAFQQEQDAICAEMIRKQLIAVESDKFLDPIEKAQRKQSLYAAFSNLSSTIEIPRSVLNPNANAFSSSFSIGLESANLLPVDLLGPISPSKLPAPYTFNYSFGGDATGGETAIGVPKKNFSLTSIIDQNLSPTEDSPSLPSTHDESLQFDIDPEKIAGFLNESPEKPEEREFNFPNITTSLRLPVTPESIERALAVAETNYLNPYNPLEAEILAIREQLAVVKAALITSDQKLQAAFNACDAWKKEATNAAKKIRIVEVQRDQAYNQSKNLQHEIDLLQGAPYLHGVRRYSELPFLSASTLKSIEIQLKKDLDEVSKLVGMISSGQCVVCQERSRNAQVYPCNHTVLCSVCAVDQTKCPYCQTNISNWFPLTQSNTTPLNLNAPPFYRSSS